VICEPAAGLLSDDERSWLADLYESNFSTVFRHCRRVLRNPDDAAEAAHEVFLRAVNALQPRLNGAASRPWLMAVARNHCLDVLRRRERFSKALVIHGVGSNGTADPQMAIADRHFVAGVFKQLRPLERRALWESAVEGRPLGDIAHDIGLSYAATAQLLHRVKRRASLVAARLAAILGLLKLGRRNPSAGDSLLDGRSLLAVVVLPVALVSMQPSSSVPRAPLAPPPHLAPAVPGMSLPPGLPDVKRLPGFNAAPGNARRDVPGAPDSSGLPRLPGLPGVSIGAATLPSVPLPKIPSTVGSVVTTIEQTSRLLPDNGIAAVAGAATGTLPLLPTVVQAAPSPAPPRLTLPT
jgi:RNA polymerase sigma factor (sigma-70 family)